jgi:hypothetical protein
MERDIIEHYNSFQTSRGNTIWCGTLSLSWSEFARAHGLKQLSLKTKHREILRMVSNFNECPFKVEDVDARSIYTKVGTGP